MRRLARNVLVSVALLTACSVPRAEASPVLFQFATKFPALGNSNVPTPLSGMLFFGSIVFDDLGLNLVATGGSNLPTSIGGPSAPITFASLTLGTSSFNLSQLSGSIAPTPAFFLSSHDFGPAFTVKPEFLPGGLTSFGLTPGLGLLGLVYSWSPIDFPAYGSTGRFIGDVCGGLSGLSGGCFNSGTLVSFTALPPRSVPEPSTLLFGLGATAAAIAIRRRRGSEVGS